MEIIKNKVTIGLIVMLLGVSYVGAMDNTHLEENSEKPIAINA